MNNDFLALFPRIWARRTQIYKENMLISRVIGNYRLENDLTVGDRVTRPYYSDMTINNYQRGSEVKLQKRKANPEWLIIDTEKEISIYIDTLDELQSKYDIQNDFISRSSYLLSNCVDGLFFQNVLDANYTANVPAPLNSTNMAQFVTWIKAQMIFNQIEMDRPLDLVLPALEASYIETMSLSTSYGFKVADESFKAGYIRQRNGYAMSYQGMETFTSNNLPQTVTLGTANPSANATIIIGGITFTFVATPTLWNQIAIGANLDATIANANLIFEGDGAIQPADDPNDPDYQSLNKVKLFNAKLMTDSASTPNLVLVTSGEVVIGGTLFVSGSRTVYGLAERRGSIDIVMQRQAVPQFNKAPLQLGWNILLVNLFGTRAFKDGRERMVKLPFQRNDT